MSKKISILFFFPIFLLTLYSCSKNGLSTTNSLNAPDIVVQSVKSFVDSVKNIDSSLNGHLINNIAWDKSYIKDISSSRYVVFFPINLIENDSTTNGLLVISSVSGNSILESYFVQINNTTKNVSGNETIVSVDRATSSFNAIKNHFLSDNSSFSGSISFYNLDNRLIYNIGYTKGAKAYLKEIQSGVLTNNKQTNSTTIKHVASGCTNYYLVTTYTDGSKDYVFLYQICDPCQQTGIIGKTGKPATAMACNGGTGPNLTAGNGGSLLISNLSKTFPVTIIRNSDGTRTIKFVDNSHISFSNATITFKVDVSNNLIQGSQQIIVSGFAEFTQNPIQYPNDFTSTNNTSVQVSFDVQGVMSYLSKPFSLTSRPTIIVTFPQNGYSPTATISWGYSFDGGAHYYY